MKVTLQHLRDYHIEDVIRRSHPLFDKVKTIADVLHENEIAKARLTLLRPEKAERYEEMAIKEERKLALKLSRLNVIV